MTKKKSKAQYHGDDEVIQRNIEQSREVIAAKQQHDTEYDIPDSIVPDVATGPEDAYPNQTDVPIGGVTNANATGGSSKRRKAN